MNWKTLLILVAAFILYLAIGALVFSALESPQEEEAKAELRAYKEAILSNFTCLSEEDLEKLVKRIKNAVERGINPLHNVSSRAHWDFSSSFFFSGTVVTTIGYGRRSPTTEGGKDFCIVYAIFGIPFTGLLLSIVGKFYQESFGRMRGHLDRILCDYCSVTKRKVRLFIVWLGVGSFTYGLLVLAPAGIFTVLEDWSYRIAHYYCFITLTTIGFGDYVATLDPKHDTPGALYIIYDVAVVFWYVFGLSFIAILISTIGTREEKTAKKLMSSVSYKPNSAHRETSSSKNASYSIEGAVELTIQDGLIEPAAYRRTQFSSCEEPEGSTKVVLNDVPPSVSRENQPGVKPNSSINDNYSGNN
ncbi:potassium channel subfamily K member 4-like [Acanthaster planci]|uniref:Potassium channel subfamily K member 4-like n=1 Tax=Acanthaster planci TaxID=133434 RepID=A0A8B7YX66_ACAPL|nr:potassium channel subfamily K member 4-like [Acanthaster planci]